MLIENEFTIPAPVDQVWKYMNDFPRVARCMPGAEIVSATDRQVKGRVKISMGPLKLAFSGVIDILEKNDGAHRVVMKATGSEEKGNVTLQPWGRVEGQLMLDSQPAANERIVAHNHVARYSDAGRRFRSAGPDIQGAAKRAAGKIR